MAYVKFSDFVTLLHILGGYSTSWCPEFREATSRICLHAINFTQQTLGSIAYGKMSSITKQCARNRCVSYTRGKCLFPYMRRHYRVQHEKENKIIVLSQRQTTSRWNAPLANEFESATIDGLRLRMDAVLKSLSTDHPFIELHERFLEMPSPTNCSHLHIARMFSPTWRPQLQ